MVYLSNEQQHVDVFFDDLHVTHVRGRLIEEQHYYPHGLLINKTVAAGAIPENKYQFEGKKMQDEIGLKLYDFHARQYDPQIGRFWGIDPADQFPSGYTGMGNDPANMIDPSGMFAETGGWYGDDEHRWADNRMAEVVAFEAANANYELPMIDLSSQQVTYEELCFEPNLLDWRDANAANENAKVMSENSEQDVAKSQADPDGITWHGSTATSPEGDELTTKEDVEDYREKKDEEKYADVLKEKVMSENGNGGGPNTFTGQATVYIETDGTGHVYVDVDGTIFSYGRYNGSYSPSSGQFGPYGDGVLLKKEGAEASDFIKGRTEKYPTNSYKIYINLSDTYSYLNNLYEGGKPVVNKKTGQVGLGRVIDTYTLVGPGGNNCATLVCRGLNAGGANIGIFQSPASLNQFFFNSNAIKNGYNMGLWGPKR